MKVAPPPGGFRGPVKRSVTIAGHQTSISLEPVFWEALEHAAEVRALPLNALIAAIDHARISADDPPNLASAIRTWLLAESETDVRLSDIRPTQTPAPSPRMRRAVRRTVLTSTTRISPAGS